MSAPESPKLSPDALAYIKAAASGDLETVRNMLAKGVPVDVRDSETWALGLVWNITALMCASAKGHLELVKLLLQSDADVSAICDAHNCDGGSGTQAIHFAMEGSHNAVAETLLDAGAAPNAVGGWASTPLVIAIKTNNQDGVRMLLRRGADIKLKPKSKDYQSPLYAAAEVSNHSNNLVKNGDQFILPPEKKSAFLQLFDVLLEAGADVNGTGALKISALQSLAGGHGVQLNELRIPLIEKLLKAGANVDLPDKNGTTALFTAVCYNNSQVLKALCLAGADVNRLSEQGTPLDRAERDLESCRKYLADPKLSSNQRTTEEQRMARVESVRNVLLEHGAKRKAELGTPPPATLKPKKGPAKSAAFGAAHFLKLMYDGEPEWAVLAVKAPMDTVADGFVKFSKAKKWTREVPVKPASESPDDVAAQAIAVVQVKDNPWTVIYRSVLYVDEDAMQQVTDGAKKLAAQFKTKALSFVAEDTSGAIACELFDTEKKSKSKEWGEDEDDDASIDKFFHQQEIYLPACYPTFKGEKFWLAVEKDSKDSIQRADLIFLET